MTRAKLKKNGIEKIEIFDHRYECQYLVTVASVPYVHT